MYRYVYVAVFACVVACCLPAPTPPASSLSHHLLSRCAAKSFAMSVCVCVCVSATVHLCIFLSCICARAFSLPLCKLYKDDEGGRQRQRRLSPYVALSACLAPCPRPSFPPSFYCIRYTQRGTHTRAQHFACISVRKL